MKVGIEEIKKALAEVKITSKIEERGRIISAVVVPIVTFDGELNLLFIKRTKDASPHSGQVSFPGGCKKEDDTDMLFTALREAEEEIGIRKEDWIIFGALDPVFTRSTSYLIYPYVAYLKKFSIFKPDPKEVERIFTVPLKMILDLFPFKKKEFLWEGKKYLTFLIEYEGEVIWGATARIIEKLCSCITSYIERQKL